MSFLLLNQNSLCKKEGGRGEIGWGKTSQLFGVRRKFIWVNKQCDIYMTLFNDTLETYFC